MQLKNYSLLALFTAVFGLSGCEYIRTHTAKDLFSGNFGNGQKINQYQSYESSVPLLRQPKNVVVCRSHQCAPAKLSMSREYIYNSLLQLFDNNNYQKLLVCQADAQARTCIENYVTLPIKVGAVPTNAYIDQVKITDVIVGKKDASLKLILNYNITYGGQVAECDPARTLLFARSTDHVLLEDAGYNCKMTTVGMTNVKTVLAIDYIDLDYGFVGGYYSIGFSGPAYGGGNGYMILKLPQNAYPLSPALSVPAGQTGVVDGNPSSTAGYDYLSTKTNGANPYASGVQVFPIQPKK